MQNVNVKKNAFLLYHCCSCLLKQQFSCVKNIAKTMESRNNVCRNFHATNIMRNVLPPNYFLTDVFKFPSGFNFYFRIWFDE